jgi:hypothetical protein
MAMHCMPDTLFRSAPFAHSSKLGDKDETFVSRHDDLNFQSILCDPETGEMTAIIDRERYSTAPRCIGYASLPIFLTSDWLPDHSHW